MICHGHLDHISYQVYYYFSKPTTNIQQFCLRIRKVFVRTKNTCIKQVAEILGDPYCRQVPLPRIPNNQAQYSTRDSAQPYVQTLGTYGQTKLSQKKPEQLFIQRQRRT